jgi:hypothetical protein
VICTRRAKLGSTLTRLTVTVVKRLLKTRDTYDDARQQARTFTAALTHVPTETDGGDPRGALSNARPYREHHEGGYVRPILDTRD